MASDSAQLSSSQPSTAAEPARPAKRAGKQIDIKKLGKYEIQKKIGAGGMGTVFLALDTQLKRAVALKVLPQEKARNPTLVRRFHSEAQAAAALEHDNIVTVYEAGEADGYNFIALEFIDGIDADNLVQQRGVIPVRRSIEIVRQVVQALDHAYAQGIVHRDIKPANLLIRRDGVVKLADLGLARSLDEEADTGITRAGTTVGTVDYMSPEQARDSKAADVRSDIYSLGCTWYHLLTGSPPFPGGSMTSKLRDHAVTPAPDPRHKNPNVPEGVVAVLRRMMAKAPDQRYQTPVELLKELDNDNIQRDSVSENVLVELAREEAGLPGTSSPAMQGGSSAELMASITGMPVHDSSHGSGGSSPSAPARTGAAKTSGKRAPPPREEQVRSKVKVDDEQPQRPLDRQQLQKIGAAAVVIALLLGVVWWLSGGSEVSHDAITGVNPEGRQNDTVDVSVSPVSPQNNTSQPTAVPQPEQRTDAAPKVAETPGTPETPSPAVAPKTVDPPPPTAVQTPNSPVETVVLPRFPRVPMPRELLEHPSATKTLRIDLTKTSDLGKQLSEQKLTTGTLVVVSGHGSRLSSPIVIRDAWVRLRFEQLDGPPLVITPRVSDYGRSTGTSKRDDALITVSRGGVELVNATFTIPSLEKQPVPHWLIQVVDGDFVLRNCRMQGPLLGTTRNKGLIQWLSGSQQATNRPFEGNREAYAAVVDSYLIGGGTLIDAAPRRRALFLRNSVLVARDDLASIHLEGNDSRIDGVIDLERCTLSATGTFFKFQAGELGAPTSAPLALFADRCVFAPPIKLGSQKAIPTLWSYTGKLLEQQQAVWWEGRCGYAHDIACWLRPGSEPPTAQSFDQAWFAQWGPGQISHPLTAVGDVMLRDELPTDSAKLEPANFELHEKCKAGAWSGDDKPIGVDFTSFTVPEIKKATAPATKKSTKPAATNKITL